MEKPISSFAAPPDWIRLAREIAVAHPSIASIQTEGETAVFLFEEDPDQISASVDQIIQKHTGILTRYKFHTSASLVGQSVQITGQEWQTLGGVITSFGFFGEAERMIGRITGQMQADGPAELRASQQIDGGDHQLQAAPFQINDTGNAWEILNFSTSLEADPRPQAGSGLVSLQGRLTGAAAASVRFVSASLLEVL